MVLNPPLSYTIERSAFISSCESGEPGFGPPAIVACSPQRSTIALSLMPHFLASPSSRAFSDAWASSARGSIAFGLFASGRGNGGSFELLLDFSGDRLTAIETSARPKTRSTARSAVPVFAVFRTRAKSISIVGTHLASSSSVFCCAGEY